MMRDLDGSRPGRPAAILVLGPIAAGKSSVVRRLRRVVGGPAVTLELDEVHRRLCPAPGDGTRYHYDDGMLVLDDRAALIAEALAELDSELARQLAIADCPIVLIEFSSADYREALDRLPSLAGFSLFVMSITAPTTVARARNARRPRSERVPDEFVAQAESAAPEATTGGMGSVRHALLDNGTEWDAARIDGELQTILRVWGIPTTTSVRGPSGSDHRSRLSRP